MRDINVAVIIYNRPAHTKILYDRLSEIKPNNLFIIADGPKSDDAAEIKKCIEARKIFSEFEWDVQIHKNYADVNLGLKNRMSSGIDWVFKRVNEAIFLEDDCIPSIEFIDFCEYALERYRKDPEVMVVTGDNFQKGRWRGDGSYYYSRYNHCWGWATWRNSWEKYDKNIKFWPKWKQSEEWEYLFKRFEENRYWTEIFDKTFNNEIDSWAYPWTASVWFNQGITVTPNVNLVTNIGFGPDATHTKGYTNRNSLTTSALGEIIPPSIKRVDQKADDFVFLHHFGGKYLLFPYNIIVSFLVSLKRLFTSKC